MQSNAKTEMLGTMEDIQILPEIVKQTNVNGEEGNDNNNNQAKAVFEQEKKGLEASPRQTTYDYYLKYQYDHVFVIGDNKLKHDIEVMIGKQTLYCAFHDARNTEHVCEHIKFIDMLNEQTK